VYCVYIFHLPTFFPCITIVSDHDGTTLLPACIPTTYTKNVIGNTIKKILHKSLHAGSDSVDEHGQRINLIIGTYIIFMVPTY